MAVAPGDRNKSGVQFVDTAEDIEKRAMEVCKKWPKAWMFIITQRTIQLASMVYEQAQAANAIFPVTTQKEKEDRLSALHKALGANRSFAKKIERAFDMFPICGEKEKDTPAQQQEKSGKLLQEFMTLCTIEEDALTGTITYTREIVLPKKNKEE